MASHETLCFALIRLAFDYRMKYVKEEDHHVNSYKENTDWLFFFVRFFPIFKLPFLNIHKTFLKILQTNHFHFAIQFAYFINYVLYDVYYVKLIKGGVLVFCSDVRVRLQ